MEEIKRTLMSKSFVGTVLMAGILLIIGTKFPEIKDGLPADSHLNMLMDSMKGQMAVFMVPVLAVLPCTTSFVDELRSGYAKFYLLRTKRKVYLWGKIISSWLCGGGALLLGALLDAGIYWIVFAPMQAVSEKSVWLVFVEKMWLMGITAGICALLGTLLAVLLMSNYMAYIAPFVLYYFLIMLVERYFPNLYCIYPKEWMNPQHDWGGGTGGLFVFLLLLSVFLMVLCYQVMDRRLSDV